MDDQRRILVCGNPDLNYIDGSSVWSQTISLVIAETELASVDFLARSVPQREELFQPLLDHPAITVIDGPRELSPTAVPGTRLKPDEMAEVARLLNEARAYDIIIIRGFDIARSLKDDPRLLSKCWMYLTDIPQDSGVLSETVREDMTRIAQGCQRILCQSDGFIRLWKDIVPDLSKNKFLLYTPVVSETIEARSPIEQRDQIVVYAGKFCPDWMTLEMAESWAEIHQQYQDAVLRLIGDKIHHDEEDYQPRMLSALRHTPGVEWMGAMTQEAVKEHLLHARLGLSWRSERLNQTLEYSTKILEYGSAGCAAIINRNPLHEDLLGEDYPLFANTHEQFIKAVEAGLTDDEMTQAAADRLSGLAGKHAFSQRVEELADWIRNLSPRPARVDANVNRKLRVLVAGHDFKFFNAIKEKLEQSGSFEFLTDQWQGHDQHNEARSRSLLEQADLIFCEWCLGNLKWYSHHKKPHQRLVARFHLQERDLPYVAESNWDNIDHISYVSEFIRGEGQKAFGFPFERTSVIPNLLDEGKFTPKKKTADARYTLGMIGVTPARKRLDRAVDLLEVLLEKDNHYCLRIKGKHPLDYDWLLKREDELTYYRNIFEHINGHPTLRHKVIFDPPGDDVNEWFTMVGFILSPSDFESFHMAVGEGMLTGSRPIIWRWPGADAIWGEEFVVNDREEAKEQILAGFETTTTPPLGMHSEVVVDEWRRVLLNLSEVEKVDDMSK